MNWRVFTALQLYIEWLPAKMQRSVEALLFLQVTWNAFTNSLATKVRPTREVYQTLHGLAHDWLFCIVLC